MTDYFVTQAGSLLMNGPTGIMVSLGIEYVSGMSLATAYMYYNYISVAIMFLIAAMAGPRSESRFLVFMPIVGGVLLWFGWIQTGSVATQTRFLVFLVIAGILGVFSYMNDINHEKYGTTGPGSKLLNIVFFIILFQAAVGMVNGFDLFPAGNAQPTPNACTVGYQCDSMGNIQLSESVNTVSTSGGLYQSTLSILGTLGLMAIGLLKMMVTVLVSVVLFSVVLNASISGIFPSVVSDPVYLGFLAVVQVGIWGLYLYTIWQMFFKPPIGEATL